MILIYLISATPTFAETSDEVILDDLYIEIGDALIHAKEADWEQVQGNINTFEQDWNKIKGNSEVSTSSVDKELSLVNDALKTTNIDQEKVQTLLTSLSKAVVSYDKEIHPVDEQAEKQKLEALYPLLNKIDTQLQAKNTDAAEATYDQFLRDWTSLETVVRTVSVAYYGVIETNIAYLRIAFSESPPNTEKAKTSIRSIQSNIEDFVSGKKINQTSEEHTISDLTSSLDRSLVAIGNNDVETAVSELNEFLLVWPVVEGEVSTKDSSLYNKIENNIPKAIGLLNSETNTGDALKILNDIQEGLRLVSEKTNYTFIDAFLILMREGLEAILIIGGLLAFLKKTNHGDKQTWIWSGAVGGILASILLAVIINLFFSKLTAATSREYLEGMIGIVAVVMMLSVGTWLHKRTNVKVWDQYVKDHLGTALEKGSLFSMSILSFLAIFREGGETIIFFAGMAPSMKMSQLIFGIVFALFLLILIGYVIIRYTAVIPLRPFFIFGTVLIYVLSFKMLGVSIHSLQVASVIPIHSLTDIPYIELIGLYPAWETLIPQIFLLFIIVGATLLFHKSRPKETITISK